jgi:hypothetical protein
MEELLETIFSIWSGPRLYRVCEVRRVAAMEICEGVAIQRGQEALNNGHGWVPLSGNE